MARTKKAETEERLRSKRKSNLTLLEMPDDGWDEDEPGHDPYIKKDKRGRPTVMTRQTLEKLRTAFRIGCSDSEACIYAMIDTQTLYNYCKKYPDFSSEKEELKQIPILDARLTVVRGVKNNTADAQWYLIRKRKAEFADMKVEAPLEQVLTVDDLEALDRGDIHMLGKSGPAKKAQTQVKVKKTKK